MAPFTAWLPRRVEPLPDLVLKIAGRGTAGLDKGMAALGQVLADRGLSVVSQAGKLGGDGALASVRMRVASRPVGSTGSGSDLLAYLERPVPVGNPFGLQWGAVLLAEAEGTGEAGPSAIPEGVIHYPVPFSDLERGCGPGGKGKGYIAVGVLTHLLGVPRDAVRHRLGGGLRRRYFEAGHRFAAEHLVKRDVNVLPEPAADTPSVLLGLSQAVELGLAGGECGCGKACAERLRRSPDDWLAGHLAAGRRLAGASGCSDLEGVTLCLGCADPAAIAAVEAHGAPALVVAADLADLADLLRTASGFVHPAAPPPWVVADEWLTGRHQGVPLDVVERFLAEAGRPRAAAATTVEGLKAEREGDCPADVGFLSWGSAQGVVRDAVSLCRSFGLRVAALYPKVLRPLPLGELEAFAATVGRVVVVEPNRRGSYTALVRSRSHLRPTTIMPEPGRALSPKDIFLLEGLGT